MKPLPSPSLRPSLLSILLGATVLTTAGCSEKKPATQVSLPVIKQTAAAPVVAPVAANTAKDEAVIVVPAIWSDLKDHTYATRKLFLVGLKGLEATVDGQVAHLRKRRAAMPSNNNTADWDFAMKEMDDARSYLKSSGEEMAGATEQTWNQQKDKVGVAWVRTQDAYGKVLASTTN